MESRLVPVNAVIGLCTPGDVYPAVLAGAGYGVAGIEVPAVAGDGQIVIDAVLFRAVQNRVVAVEAKSGANVDERQARRYAELTSDDVVRAAALTVREAGPRRIQSLYVCLAQTVDRVLRGLGQAGVAFPVLTVSAAEIAHHGAAFDDPELRSAFAEPVPVPGPPPRFVAVDVESPDESFDTLAGAALVATLSHRRQQVSVPALAEQAIAHLAIYGKAARKRLVDRVDAAARRAAERDPATFEYHGRTGTRDHAIVRFVRSPEDVARQGRTQVYQAIARAAGKPPRGRRAASTDQMALFDELIDELGDADDIESDATDNDEEESE